MPNFASLVRCSYDMVTEPVHTPEADALQVDRARTDLLRRLQALENARVELRDLLTAFSTPGTPEEQTLADDLQARYERSFRGSGC